jgi:hypothetical protein
VAIGVNQTIDMKSSSRIFMRFVKYDFEVKYKDKTQNSSVGRAWDCNIHCHPEVHGSIPCFERLFLNTFGH